MTNPRIEEIRKRVEEDALPGLWYYQDLQYVLDELAKANALLGECEKAITERLFCNCAHVTGVYQHEYLSGVCFRCQLLGKIRGRK